MAVGESAGFARGLAHPGRVGMWDVWDGRSGAYNPWFAWKD
jgi:hypothetical protein